MSMESVLSEPLVLKSDDPIIATLNFVPHRHMAQRRVRAFAPGPGEPQTLEVRTPWGAMLTAKSGDMLVSEMDAPEEVWPVDAGIFDQTYIVTGPGLCVKRAVTLLTPLTDVTGGDEDRMVTVHTLEGEETVRAGDFLLAKGVRGEIWPYPKEKAAALMRPVTEQ